jgi:hypothetical protein
MIISWLIESILGESLQALENHHRAQNNYEIKNYSIKSSSEFFPCMQTRQIILIVAGLVAV